MKNLIKRVGEPLKERYAAYMAAPDFKVYVVQRRQTLKYGIIKRDKTLIAPFIYDREQIFKFDDGYIIKLVDTSTRKHFLWYSKKGVIFNQILDKVEVKKMTDTASAAEKAIGYTYLEVWQDGKCGIYNLCGHQTIPCDFDEIEFAPRLYLSKYRLTEGQTFSVKCFLVKKGIDVGLFDSNGKVLLEVEYESIQPKISPNLYVVKDHGQQSEDLYDAANQTFIVWDVQLVTFLTDCFIYRKDGIYTAAKYNGREIFSSLSYIYLCSL